MTQTQNSTTAKTRNPETDFRIIVVEDDIGLSVLIKRNLVRSGHIVETVKTGSAALEKATQYPESLFFIDYSLPDMTGKELVMQLQECNKSIPFIIMTGHADVKMAVDFIKMGALDFLVKDSNFITLLPQVANQVISKLKKELELKKAEEALKESEILFCTLADSAPVMIWISDADDQHVYFNRQWLEFRGRTLEEETGQGYTTGIHPDDIERYLSEYQVSIGEHVKSQLEYRLRRHDGEFRWVMSSAVPRYSSQGEFLGHIGSCVDITENKRAQDERVRMEAQITETQKLEAIGSLAGGIAHDFNNLLGSIIGYTEMELNAQPETSKNHTNLKQVLKASKLATELVQQILTFSRRGEPEVQPIDIQKTVRQTFKLLRASIPSTVEIHEELDEFCGTIEADPSQIHQVIMNLGTNALQALHGKSGTIVVKLETCEVDASFVRLHHKLEEKTYVRLIISDTGCGMTKETIERIFEPFFTTRGIGDGSGLGLSVVHGIVASHKGHISVYSELRSGTTVQVYFPQSAKDKKEEAPQEVPVEKGSETVLLVDDNEQFGWMSERMLESLGYSVKYQTSANTALELFKVDPKKFDLVITDQTMPEISGTNLAKKLREIRSDIPIILTTGFSRQISSENYKSFGISGYLMKPFVTADLAKTVRGILEEK